MHAYGLAVVSQWQCISVPVLPAQAALYNEHARPTLQPLRQHTPPGGQLRGGGGEGGLEHYLCAMLITTITWDHRGGSKAYCQA
jgi:hypothetical protein